MKNKKIGIVIFKYPLGASLTLINSAILLARQGYRVHIFIDKKSLGRNKIKFKEKDITLHPIKDTRGVRNQLTNESAAVRRYKKILAFRKQKFKKVPIGQIGYLSFIFFAQMPKLVSKIKESLLFLYWRLYAKNIFSAKKMAHCINCFFKDIPCFYQNMASFIDDKYLCIIGVEPEGLIAASLAAKEKIPVIYFNMELLLAKECKNLKKKVLKSLEKKYSKKCFLTLIQDERRANFFIADNQVPKEKVICVPVAPLGKAYKKGSDYLHKKLNIGRDKKIIICAGSIAPWTMSLKLAKLAQKWNDDMVLVLHDWRNNLKNDPYIKQLKALTKNKKVFLSLSRVPWKDLPKLLSSAGIGIAFYEDRGVNYRETCLSSNKIASYLKAGLPLITSDYLSFRKIIGKYKCGKCAEGPHQVERLAKEIFKNYPFFRKNALRCYKEKYNFAASFNKVIKRIKTIK